MPVRHGLEHHRIPGRGRLAEDLVELLSTMGHEPQWEVTLGLALKFVMRLV